MSSAPSDRDPVERLAEQFLERYRHGERPALTEFTERYPELAGAIRQLFPALVVLEELGSENEPGADCRRVAPGPMPERLGEYRLLREVGRGGMGVVYEAVQESLGRHVALKVLRFSSLAGPVQCERFQREAKAAARLHHTNIVPVFGVGEQAGVHYYAMQLIEGQGLDAVLQEVQQFRQAPGEASATVAEDSVSAPTLLSGSQGDLATRSEADYYRAVARIGRQAAQALAHAHAQGVVHRDIKPSNLLLDRHGTLWVGDFGLAKLEDGEPLTGSGDLLGTLRYLAPERFRGAADARSDVYSLGLTLYEMLTLRPAFADADRARLMNRVAREEPPRPRQLDPRIPRDLETIVLKAMAKEPVDRYAKADMLALDLERFLNDQPIAARRSRMAERAWRWCRRNPGLAVLGGAVGLLLLVVAVGSLLSAGLLRVQRDRARDSLWEARLAQARAGRMTPLAGRRFDGLRALDEAHLLLPVLPGREERTLALRNDFLACLALADLGVGREWEGYSPGCAGVAFDPTLERYARSDEQGNISLCPVGTDRESVRLPGDGLGAWSLKFSRDGQLLAAGYQRRYQPSPKRFQVWSCEPSRVLFSVPFESCGEPDFSPDGGRVAVGGQMAGQEAAVYLYPLTPGSTGTKQFPVDGAPPDHVAFHPDGHKLAISRPRAVEVRDAATGKVLATLPHDREVRHIAWSADGKRLAAANGRNISLWEADGAHLRAVLVGHEGLVTEVAFSHAGDLLASKGHDGTVRLWDVESSRQLVKSASVYTGCAELHFSPDDRLLGFGADGPRLRTWEVAPGRECRLLTVHQAQGWQSLDGCFSPDGRLLAVAERDGARLWDCDTGRELALVPQKQRWSALFSPDGRHLLTTGSNGLHRWPITSNSDGLRIGPPELLGSASALQQAVLDGAGRTLAARTGSGRAIVLKLDRAGTPVLTAEHPQLHFLALSPDGRWLASGTWFGAGVKVWEVASGRVVKQLPLPSSASVAFSPDGRRLVLGTGDAYAFWDVASWRLEYEVGKHPDGDVPGEVSFAGDGSLLAVRHAPAELRLLDPSTGRVLAQLQTPDQHTIAWHRLSGDGSRLAAATAGQGVYLWDLRLVRRELRHRQLDWDPAAP